MLIKTIFLNLCRYFLISEKRTLDFSSSILSTPNILDLNLNKQQLYLIDIYYNQIQHNSNNIHFLQRSLYLIRPQNQKIKIIKKLNVPIINRKKFTRLVTHNKRW